MRSISRLSVVACLLAACSGEPRDVATGAETPDQGESPATVSDAGADAEVPEPADDAGACDDPDGDGYGPGCARGDDCEPAEPHAHPGETERCFDHTDNDCDGLVDEDCDCDPASPDCGVTPPPPPQTLGEFVFELSRGAMALDPMCGAARQVALDPERGAIVSTIDGLVTTDDAVTMGEVAHDVLRPIILSGELEATATAGTDAVALLVDDAFDPERRTLNTLVQLLGADSALTRADLFALASAALADPRMAELLHQTTSLAARPVLEGSLADAVLQTASDALAADSQTARCTGLSLTGLSDRLLDPAALGDYRAAGDPVFVPDHDVPGATLDVARTGIALTTELAAAALRAGMAEDVTAVLDGALGTPARCGAGCASYGPDHPLADASHVALDLLRYDESRALLEAVAVVLRERPEVAESLLVSSGQLVERVRAADLALEPAQVVKLARDLLPLFARIFAAGGDTPRLLLRAIHDLGGTARYFPTRLGWTLDYRSLVKSPTCSDNAPDLSRSAAVDYGSPRGTNNRSSLEQVIELLAAVDCGSVPFTGGKSVGVFVLDTVAGMRPGTVCGVTDVLLGALDVTGVVGDFFTKLALRTIGCSNADRVVQHLDSLEDLAASGALDFLIPLDKVFADQGQLETLIDIFSIVAADLALDDDADPATRSVFRQLEPVLSQLIREGSAEALFDLTDVLVTVQTTDAAGRPATLGDVLVDFAAFAITQHDVPTRHSGVVSSSHGAELLGPLERIATRLSRDASQAAAGRVVDHVASYLRADANGGLARPEMVPFARLVLDGLVEVWSAPRATRDCYVDGLMADADRLWTSEALGTAMAAANVVRSAPERALVEAVSIDFLSAPQPAAEDVRAALWRVLAGALQTDLGDDADLGALVPYLSRVLDPDVTHGGSVLTTLDTLVQGDPDEVFLGILRKSVAASGGADAPAGALIDAYTDALAITGDSCSPENEPWSARGLDSAVVTLLGFLRDPETGMPKLFDALEQMAANP